MKIGFLLMYPYGGQGGTEQALINLTKALNKQNVSSTILCLEIPENPSFLKNFEQVIFIDQQPLFHHPSLNLLPKFLSKIIKKRKLANKTFKIIKKMDEELKLEALVILDLPRRHKLINRVVRKFKSASNIKFYSWIHALVHDVDPKDVLEFKELFKIYDGHLAISRGIHHELTNIFEITEPKLIYNPIPTAPLMHRDYTKFLFIGRIAPDKQVYEILNMLASVKGGWSLDIYGSTGDLSKDNDFREFIKSLPIAHKVRFHGWVENPWDKIKSTGVLLLNSKKESFGLVLAEAMMRGIPCLSCDCPVGPREIIKENVNGWLFPPNKYHIAASLLQEIIDQKRELPPAKMVQESVLHFSSDVVAKDLIQYIHK